MYHHGHHHRIGNHWDYSEGDIDAWSFGDGQGGGEPSKFFDGWASEELAVGDVVACLACLYLQSQAGIQGLAGFYWCYSDAYLMTIGKKCPCRAVRVEEVPTVPTREEQTWYWINQFSFWQFNTTLWTMAHLWIIYLLTMVIFQFAKYSTTRG